MVTSNSTAGPPSAVGMRVVSVPYARLASRRRGRATVEGEGCAATGGTWSPALAVVAAAVVAARRDRRSLVAAGRPTPAPARRSPAPARSAPPAPRPAPVGGLPAGRDRPGCAGRCARTGARCRRGSDRASAPSSCSTTGRGAAARPTADRAPAPGVDAQAADRAGGRSHRSARTRRVHDAWSPVSTPASLVLVGGGDALAGVGTGREPAVFARGVACRRWPRRTATALRGCRGHERRWATTPRCSPAPRSRRAGSRTYVAVGGGRPGHGADGRRGPGRDPAGGRRPAPRPGAGRRRRRSPSCWPARGVVGARRRPARRVAARRPQRRRGQLAAGRRARRADAHRQRQRPRRGAGPPGRGRAGAPAELRRWRAAAVAGVEDARRCRPGRARCRTAAGSRRDDRSPPTPSPRSLAVAAVASTPSCRAGRTGLPVAGFTRHAGATGSSTAAGHGRGVVRAKTGTLTGVSSSLAASSTADGRLLAFAFARRPGAVSGTAAARPRLDRSRRPWPAAAALTDPAAHADGGGPWRLGGLPSGRRRGSRHGRLGARASRPRAGWCRPGPQVTRGEARGAVAELRALRRVHAEEPRRATTPGWSPTRRRHARRGRRPARLDPGQRRRVPRGARAAAASSCSDGRGPRSAPCADTVGSKVTGAAGRASLWRSWPAGCSGSTSCSRRPATRARGGCCWSRPNIVARRARARRRPARLPAVGVPARGDPPRPVHRRARGCATTCWARSPPSSTPSTSTRWRWPQRLREGARRRASDAARRGGLESARCSSRADPGAAGDPRPAHRRDDPARGPRRLRDGRGRPRRSCRRVATDPGRFEQRRAGPRPRRPASCRRLLGIDAQDAAVRRGRGVRAGRRGRRVGMPTASTGSGPSPRARCRRGPRSRRRRRWLRPGRPPSRHGDAVRRPEPSPRSRRAVAGRRWRDARPGVRSSSSPAAAAPTRWRSRRRSRSRRRGSALRPVASRSTTGCRPGRPSARPPRSPPRRGSGSTRSRSSRSTVGRGRRARGGRPRGPLRGAGRGGRPAAAPRRSCSATPATTRPRPCCCGLARGSGAAVAGRHGGRGRAATGGRCSACRRATTCGVPARRPAWPRGTTRTTRTPRSPGSGCAASVLPVLEAELGPGVAEALARTAELLRDDADALDVLGRPRAGRPRARRPGMPAARLDVAVLRRACRRRTPPGAAARRARPPGRRRGRWPPRTSSVDRLVTDWHGQGPLDLPGPVVAAPAACGRLTLVAAQPLAEPATEEDRPGGRDRHGRDLEKVLITEEEIHAQARRAGRPDRRRLRRARTCCSSASSRARSWSWPTSPARCTRRSRWTSWPSPPTGRGTKSSGVVRILKDLDADITGRHVLVVEDIIDSGLTLSWLLSNLRSRGPASLEVCALLRKPEAVKVDDRRAVRRVRHPERVRRRLRPGLRRALPQSAFRRDARPPRLRLGNKTASVERCHLRMWGTGRRAAVFRDTGVPSYPGCTAGARLGKAVSAHRAARSQDAGQEGRAAIAGHRINGSEALLSRAIALDTGLRGAGAPRHVRDQPRRLVREGRHLEGRPGHPEERGRRSAQIIDKDQRIEVKLKNGKRLQASWVSGQGIDLAELLQSKADAGQLRSYTTTVPKQNAPGESAVQLPAHRHHRVDLPVHHEPDAGRRLPGDELRQVQGQADHQGHPEDDLRRRRRGRRGDRGAAGDQGVPAEPGQVPGHRRQDPQGRAALRPARHRQDAAGACGRRRGRRAVLLDLRLGLRRDVRRRRRVPGP